MSDTDKGAHRCTGHGPIDFDGDPLSVAPDLLDELPFPDQSPMDGQSGNARDIKLYCQNECGRTTTWGKILDDNVGQILCDVCKVGDRE